MNSSILTDLSIDSSTLRVLTDEQKERLTNILDRYLCELERGVPHNPSQLVGEHPDLAVPLQLYLARLNDLQGVSAGFSNKNDNPGDIDCDDGDRKRLGDFVLGGEIGRGGMGVVYEAHQISLNRRVALKVLPFAAILDSKQLARFKNEAQAAAQLHHPNIVPVFAIGAERGVHYYAMQLIDGQPLDRAIRELRRQARITLPDDIDASDGESIVDRAIEDLCPSTNKSFLTVNSENRREYYNTAIRLGIDAAHALHAAHEYGIVHRDVKPSNLLLDNRGKIWVTDFGLARFQNDGKLTRTGDLLGTLRYMSPEQALGKTTQVDHRADIYSLAATLYELLTLHPVVSGNDEPSVLRTIDEHDPRPLRAISPDIPADLETVVMKALSRTRDERYVTAMEFADDLQRVLDGKPTVARPPTLTERASKWAYRHKRAVRLAAGIGLCAVVGFAVSTFLIAREKTKAVQNFERAEERLEKAHEAVDLFGAQLAEELAHLSGAEDLRREVLQRTLHFYQDFVKEAADDPSLQDDLALTYSKMGTLMGQIGSTDEAMKAHEKALQLFGKLAASEPKESKYRRRLAMCRNNMALTLRHAGRVDEARAAYKQAIELQQELTRNGENADVVSDLALSYTNLGLLQSEMNQPELATESLSRAIQLQDLGLAENANNVDVLRKLAASYNNLSSVYVASNPAKAVECCQIALEHQQKVVASCPSNLQPQSDWALTYNNLGAVQSRMNEFEAAAASFERAIAIQQKLVDAAPAQRTYRRDLAVSLNNRGRMLNQLGTPADADDVFRQALTLQKALVAQYPDDLELQSSLGGVYNNLGITLEELHRIEDAATAYKHAVEHQRIAFAQASSVARYRGFLSTHYYNYGRLLRQSGHPDQAARSALARRDLWPKDPQRLFTVAEELALAASSLEAVDGEFTSRRCAELAIETLEQAVAVGLRLPPDLWNNESFASLRDFEAFAKLARK